MHIIFPHSLVRDILSEQIRAYRAGLSVGKIMPHDTVSRCDHSLGLCHRRIGSGDFQPRLGICQEIIRAGIVEVSFKPYPEL